MSRETKTWETYEEVARALLDEFASEFGLEKFEGKQKITGQISGTEWEVDAKGVGEQNEIFMIVECRRYTNSRQNQEKIGSLAYRIIDTGAEGGIIVSPFGLQKGAEKVAKNANVISVLLNENSTTLDYFMSFFEKIRVGASMVVEKKLDITISGKIIRADGKVENI